MCTPSPAGWLRRRVLSKEGRAVEAAELLRAAVALWRGPCLSGIPNQTLRTKALRLDEERLNATETYLELELGLGRHHQLVGEIGRLVYEHPLRDRLRALLMLALYRSGRQAEALDTYRAGRDLLIEELGLEPGEELRLLETAILSGDAALQHGWTPSGTARSASRCVPQRRARAVPARRATASTAGGHRRLRRQRDTDPCGRGGTRWLGRAPGRGCRDDRGPAGCG